MRILPCVAERKGTIRGSFLRSLCRPLNSPRSQDCPLSRFPGSLKSISRLPIRFCVRQSIQKGLYRSDQGPMGRQRAHIAPNSKPHTYYLEQRLLLLQEVLPRVSAFCFLLFCFLAESVYQTSRRTISSLYKGFYLYKSFYLCERFYL